MEYKPLLETWLSLSEVSAEQPLHEALGRPHFFLILPSTRSKSAANVALFLQAGRVQYGRPGEEGICLHFTTAQTWLLTKAEAEAKRRVMSPGLGLYLPTNLCPQDVGTHLEGGAQHFSFVQGLLQRFHSGVALLQRVPQAVDDDLAVPFLPFWSRDGGWRGERSDHSSA